MQKFINTRDQRTYGVTSVHGESKTLFHVVDCDAPEPEQPCIVATYTEKWRAENHAICGCGCPIQWHYYHGAKHEPEVLKQIQRRR